MKNRFLSFISVAVFLLGMAGCQSPEDLTPSISRSGINSLTASFPDDDRDENSFDSEIDHTNHVITVVIPYNYPRASNNVMTMANLTKMRVKANLDDNVYVNPSLLYMDLTQENHFTLTDQTKNKMEYKVIAEIRKSAECAITKYEIPSIGLSGVIDETNKTISLISVDNIGSVKADISISHHATISPDPSEVAMDHDVDFQLTVTAQNGTTKAVYTVQKATPQKIEMGIRTNSHKLLWAKKLTDLGITDQNMTTGISVTYDYVVLNTRGKNSIYLNGRTGEIAGSMDISSIVGSLTNFYGTADSGNNILICNLTPNAGPTFKVWKCVGVSGTPEPFISFDTSLALGRKISVSGSIDGNAIITAPIYSSIGQFARWQVANGTLVSQTPTILTAGGTASFGTNADIIYTDPTNLNSDYFLAYYGVPYKFAWYNGSTHTVKTLGAEISSNWILNATDYVVFNKWPYAIHNSVNSFTWGSDDSIHMYDLIGSTLDDKIYVCESGIYGAKALGGQNPNATGDVVFKVSENGYYLYVYFMFTDGYVVGVQYDCISM